MPRDIRPTLMLYGVRISYSTQIFDDYTLLLAENDWGIHNTSIPYVTSPLSMTYETYHDIDIMAYRFMYRRNQNKQKRTIQVVRGYCRKYQNTEIDPPRHFVCTRVYQDIVYVDDNMRVYVFDIECSEVAGYPSEPRRLFDVRNPFARPPSTWPSSRNAATLTQFFRRRRRPCVRARPHSSVVRAPASFVYARTRQTADAVDDNLQYSWCASCRDGQTFSRSTEKTETRWPGLAKDVEQNFNDNDHGWRRQRRDQVGCSRWLDDPPPWVLESYSRGNSHSITIGKNVLFVKILQ